MPFIVPYYIIYGDMQVYGLFTMYAHAQNCSFQEMHVILRNGVYAKESCLVFYHSRFLCKSGRLVPVMGIICGNNLGDFDSRC